MKKVKEAAESLEWAIAGPAVNAEARSFPGTRPMKQLVKSGELCCSCVWQGVLLADLNSSGRRVLLLITQSAAGKSWEQCSAV